MSTKYKTIDRLARQKRFYRQAPFDINSLLLNLQNQIQGSDVLGSKVKPFTAEQYDQLRLLVRSAISWNATEDEISDGVELVLEEVNRGVARYDFEILRKMLYGRHMQSRVRHTAANQTTIELQWLGSIEEHETPEGIMRAKEIILKANDEQFDMLSDRLNGIPREQTCQRLGVSHRYYDQTLEMVLFGIEWSKKQWSAS